MKYWLKLGLVLLAATTVHCGKDDEHPEQITKLRPLGVVANPIVAYPGQTVSLTYYAATPAGQTLTISDYKPENSRSTDAPSPSVDFSHATDEKTDYAGLTLHKLSAQFVVPADLQTALVAGSPLRLHFGSHMQSSANEKIDVVSDLLVLDKDAPEIKKGVTPPTSSIVFGDSAGRDQEVDISATIAGQTMDASYKIGWFVSQGEVKNRYAKTTKWKTPKDAGKHVIIFTARGKDSKAFTIAVKEVAVN